MDDIYALCSAVMQMTLYTLDAPSLHALNEMFSICYYFADEFGVIYKPIYCKPLCMKFSSAMNYIGVLTLDNNVISL